MSTTRTPALAVVLAIGIWSLSPARVAASSNVVMWPDAPLTAVLAVPANLGDVTGLTAGYGHACAIDAASACVCWGMDTKGQATVPLSLGPVKAVSGGYAHTCVITKASGANVVCFGDATQGQTTPPAGLTAIAVSTGIGHSCALDSSGTPKCWGDDTFGQASPPPGLTGLTQIAAGGRYTVAVDAQGNLVGWGDNTFGQTTPPAGIQGTVAKVSAASQFSTCVLTKTGGVSCFGSNTFGESAPPPMGKATSVSVGGNYACASLATGGVVCWGANNGGLNQTQVPAGLSGVTEVAAGFMAVYALKGSAPPPGPSGPSGPRCRAVASLAPLAARFSAAVVLADRRTPIRLRTPADGEGTATATFAIEWPLVKGSGATCGTENVHKKNAALAAAWANATLVVSGTSVALDKAIAGRGPADGDAFDIGAWQWAPAGASPVIGAKLNRARPLVFVGGSAPTGAGGAGSPKLAGTMRGADLAIDLGAGAIGPAKFKSKCRARLAVKTASIVIKCGALKLAYNGSWAGGGAGGNASYTVSNAKFTFARGKPAVVPFASAQYVTA